MNETAKARFARSYLWAVPLLGLGAITAAARDVSLQFPGVIWLALTASTTLVSAYAIKIPGSVVRISVSETLVFLSTLQFGPAAGTLTAAVDACVMSLRLRPSLRTPHRVLFNVGALALSVWPSAQLYFYLAGLSADRPAYEDIGSFVGPLYVFAGTVFLLNSSLVAVAVALDRGMSAVKVWRSQFLSFAGSYLASAAIAAILIVLANAKDYTFVALLLPLAVVSFLAVRTTLGRLGDEHQHLVEVNRLYLSTIETLAMAIDAKDQVTHGHIRRVQRYAVGLARVLGVSDEQQIRAIEAAALLHDMGKLAIPEFILNKPGKLTPREFAVMKTHAALGADLLSSIQFPYPVVPIVRHHHEHWDGTGYPDGISGATIPIGARILAVVDCYDALTSHRPYRPAMDADAALEILTQRRGRMYDPLIVDAFVREHDSLRAQADDLSTHAVIRAAQTDALAQPKPEHEAANLPPIESLRALSSLAPLRGGASALSVCRQLVLDLRAIVPFDTVAVFVLDDAATVLNAEFAEGSAAALVRALRIPLGERLTGWVGAHRAPVWNADATLDCFDGTDLTFGSSVPLALGDNLVAVLTLYGRQDQEASVEERHAVESLLPAVAAALSGAIARPSMAIDCYQPEARAVALQAMDALLSHGRHGSDGTFGSIVAVFVGAVASDLKHLSQDGVPDLAALICPAFSAARCVLCLPNGHYLVCSLDGSNPDQLRKQIEAAAAGLPIRITTVAVTTTLALQDNVRRMLQAGDSRSPARSFGEGVH